MATVSFKKATRLYPASGSFVVARLIPPALVRQICSEKRDLSDKSRCPFSLIHLDKTARTC